ncbi:N-acetylmuramoyl-L-alanine amidase family protein [Bacillus pseudomycoides]|uniref:N-acetylmuramoyl-L-alanine amidase family protein n=1 Tax=Bacillus pseudomycoides TaxID=64104 RepID=UPI000BF838F6|nr:N-acetylmuramoyl-L-alanine amidase family protein [Bacillus pseudomycoides]PEP56760.1 hypothetical protein CN564_16180 [Bacillus pseudomycoides]PHC98768.1 hypothetical protein COF36_00195 [Bacillus pseudomycoides]
MKKQIVSMLFVAGILFSGIQPHVYAETNKQSTPITGWVQKQHAWYYYINGKMETEWVNTNNNWYFLEKDGVMKTGWYQEGPHSYFLNKDGAMHTGWLKQDEKWYFFNKNGAMQYGWVSDSGKWYFLGKDGVMKTGWHQNSPYDWYYLNKDGAMHTGWVLDQNRWYFLNAKGIMQTGWVLDQNKWYFLDKSGAMKTGWFVDDQLQWYYLDKDGVWNPDAKPTSILYNVQGTWSEQELPTKPPYIGPAFTMMKISPISENEAVVGVSSYSDNAEDIAYIDGTVTFKNNKATLIFDQFGKQGQIDIEIVDGKALLNIKLLKSSDEWNLIQGKHTLPIYRR